jgi:MFS family permease
MFAVIQVGGALPITLWGIWQQRLGFSTGTLALVFAVYALGTLISLILLVPLSDQIGRRPALFVSIGLAVTSTVLYLAIDSVALLFAARFVSGMAVAITTGSGAAALRELEPHSNARRASLVTTVATLGAIGLGPLLGGVLAQYAGHPLTLVFWIYLVLLVGASVCVGYAQETVAVAKRVRLTPNRLALPARARVAFAVAAAAGFCAFALLGLFSSVVPSFLGNALHERNHAIAGAIVSTIFIAATLAQLLLFRLSPTNALTLGLPLLLVGLSLIALGLWQASLAIFVGGTVAGGVAVGLSFMGSLATVNQIAEPERRAQILAAYFVACYAGIAVPAIAVGEAADSIGAKDATLVCAIALTAVLLLALSARARVPALRRLSA